MTKSVCTIDIPFLPTYQQIGEEQERLKAKVLRYEALLLEIHKDCLANCGLGKMRTVIIDRIEKVWLGFEPPF
jgi:hypothetical protein